MQSYQSFHTRVLESEFGLLPSYSIVSIASALFLAYLLNVLARKYLDNQVS